MYAVKQKKQESRFVHDGLADNGGQGSGWVGQAITGAVILAQAFLGRKGDQGKENRRQKRQALSQVGFRWDRTKGTQPEDSDNIDGWYDVSLDNISDAYQKHGQIVAQLHNQGVFNKSNTQSLTQIEQVIQQHGGSTNASLLNLGTGSGGGAASYIPWIAVGAVSLIVVAVASKPRGKSKK